jgi:hypothetical protein
MAWFSGSKAVGQGPGQQETRRAGTAGPSFVSLIIHPTMIWLAPTQHATGEGHTELPRFLMLSPRVLCTPTIGRLPFPRSQP